MKVSLKKLLTKVLRRLIEYTRVVETQTITACGKSWTFRRMGNIVFIDAPNDIRTASAGVTTIGTLRASMRPGYFMQMHAGNIGGTDMRLLISEGGTVQYYTPYAISSATNCSFSGYSYIVGGVLRNPVIARLTAIFTSLLSGGDVDEGHSQEAVDEGADITNCIINRLRVAIKRKYFISENWSNGMCLWTIIWGQNLDRGRLYISRNITKRVQTNGTATCVQPCFNWAGRSRNDRVGSNRWKSAHILKSHSRILGVLDNLPSIAISERRWAA